MISAAACTPQQVFVKGVKGYNDVILPEYDDMTDNAYRKTEDGKFVPWFSFTDAAGNVVKDEDSIKIRHDSATGLRALVKEAEDDE
jgi:hypothetical protein